MSIAKHARASEIMNKSTNGHYVKNNKFHDFGSVVTDSLLGQQAEADKRLAILRAKRNKVKA